MLARLRDHWPEYLIEAALLGLFMLSASAFGVVLEHPSSPVHSAVAAPLVRRALMGCAMGLTAMALIYSPLGQRSGAHMNPAVTLTYLRLGKVMRADAVFYVLAQFAGGAAGMALATGLLGGAIADPAVAHVVTRPGPFGPVAAFAGELAISFLLMTVVLRVSSAPRVARWTGVCAGVLVALYITVEAPLSGMSMNPARTFGSALVAGVWSAYWLYVAAPLAGMGLAAWLHVHGRREVRCAKLHHDNPRRCIFCGANTRVSP